MAQRRTGRVVTENWAMLPRETAGLCRIRRRPVRGRWLVCLRASRSAVSGPPLLFAADLISNGFAFLVMTACGRCSPYPNDADGAFLAIVNDRLVVRIGLTASSHIRFL